MSKSKGKLVDTNLIIRYLVQDDPKKTEAVEKLLKNPREKLIIPDITFAEIVWVLQSFYGVHKDEVIEKLAALMALESIKVNKSIIQKTLENYLNYPINFVDAYQAAYAQVKRLDIYSYDKDFDKIKEIKRYEP